jgi:hypothetical protein
MMDELNILQNLLIDFVDPITNEENTAILSIFDYSDMSVYEETFIMILLNSTFRNMLDPDNDMDRDSLNELARALNVVDKDINTITDIFGGLKYSHENENEQNQIIFGYLNVIIGNIEQALRLFTNG